MSQLKTAALVLKDCSSYIHGPVGLSQNILQKSLPHKKYKQKQTVPPLKKNPPACTEYCHLHDSVSILTSELVKTIHNSSTENSIF